MKNNLIILTKALLKNGTNTQAKGKKNRSVLLIIALIAVAFTPLAIELVRFLSFSYTTLETIGQQGILLSIGFAVSSLIIFLFGIFYVLNTFYFANDVETLLPLPLKPGEILGAKFIITVIYEYLTELLFVLPIIVVYGVKSSAGVVFWVYSAIIFLLLPVIPIALASYIIIPLMRFTGFAKNKDRFRLVSSFFALAVGLGFNFWMQRYAGSSVTPESLQDLFLKGNNSLVGTISRIFPTSKFAAESLVNTSNVSGFISIALFFLICALAFVIFLYMGEALYFKGVMGVSESSARRKKLTEDELEKSISSNSILKSYLLKKLRILFRTPVYFLNCVVTNVLYPAFLLIPFIAQSNSSQMLGQLGDLINNKNYAGYVLAIAFGFILFASVSNGITSTSVSREGSNLYINKYIPVSYSKQLMAKVMSGVLLSTVGMFSLLIVAAVLFKLEVTLLFAVLLAGLPGVLFTAFVGILIDIYNPKLNWDNEQKAVKQNFNVLFAMLICFAIGGLTIFGVFMFKLNFAETLAGILVLYGLLDLLLYYLVTTIGVTRFSSIEA